MGANRNSRRLRAIGSVAAAAALLLAATPAAAQCPSVAEAELELRTLPIDGASRTGVVGLGTPHELYARALGEPDTAFVDREGNQTQGVMMAAVSIEAFWMALNDEDHHDEGGYLPLRDSQVISGHAGEEGRLTFQFFRKAGLGRWWVNRMEMNAELYAATEGRLWELVWEDVMEEYPGDQPPVEIEGSVPGIRSSIGCWLLIRLREGCTLVEYAADGDPGGVVGAFQWLAASRALRSTMEGMLEIARVHLAASHTSIRFVRPDGTPLGDRSRD